MTGRKYRFIEDPGHGWLEVPIGELHALGIADQISTYSYFDRVKGFAYLEEDCDATTFIVAKVGSTNGSDLARWFTNQTTREHQAKTFIRDLPRYPFGPPPRGWSHAQTSVQP